MEFVKGDERLAVTSNGEWAACEDCHSLIEKRDREGLAERSAKLLLSDDPLWRGKNIDVKDLTVRLRQIHDDFWRHRLGRPTPVS